MWGTLTQTRTTCRQTVMAPVHIHLPVVHGEEEHGISKDWPEVELDPCCQELKCAEKPFFRSWALGVTAWCAPGMPSGAPICALLESWFYTSRLPLAKEVVRALLLQQRLCWLSFRRHIGALPKHCHMSRALSVHGCRLMHAGRMKFDPREDLGSTEEGRARLLKALMSNSLSGDGGAVVGHVDPEHLPRRFLPPGCLGQTCHGCATAAQALL